MGNKEQEERIGIRDPSFHFLDAEILEREFRKYDVEVLISGEYPLEYESSFYQLDGRENAVLIVRKK